jgi:hypothetical protein
LIRLPSVLASLSFQYSQSLPWVILLVIGLWLMVLLFYPGQLKPLPGKIRWLPPTLRILAMTALALSILRPVVTRARIASERAPVVIFLDNSRSMSVVNPNRLPGEWVGIAAALGQLPAGAREKEITSVQVDCDRLSAQADDVARAREELEYAKLSGRGTDAAQQHLDQTIADLQATARDARSKARGNKQLAPMEGTLAYLVQIHAGIDRNAWLDHIRDKARAAADNAEQARLSSDGELYLNDANIRQACLPLQALSRLQISQTAAFDPVNGLIARLSPETSVQVFGISDRVIPVAAVHHETGSEPLSADGTISNLSGGMRAVLESLKASPPRAVVLFSDGRQVNADGDPATMAALAGIPIFTVNLAARAGMKDLSIISVEVNAKATVGETVTLNARVRDTGLKGASTDLTCTAGGREQIRRIHFTDENPVSVSFPIAAKQPGELRLSLDLAAVSDEVCFENNHAERWVTVFPPTARPTGANHPATRPIYEAEMADVSTDDSWLRHLAETSGGQFYRLDQIDLLPRRLADIRDDVSRPIEVPLWDGSYLFVLVLGCLAAEWGMRKRYGLA